MKTRYLFAAVATLAAIGSAQAQQQGAMTVPASPGMVAPATPANGVSQDPFVQKRQADADATAQYKAQKKEMKRQNKIDKKLAKQQMKAQKKEATAERNARLAQPAEQSDLNQGH